MREEKSKGLNTKMEKNENGLSPKHFDCSKRQLGMVYSPMQCWRMLYSVDKALKRGSLFEELDKPLTEER